MPVTREEWALAYAAQARSDFAVYKILVQLNSIEDCHRLHYLQMACEKIAKAYRLRDTEASVEQSLTSHRAFSNFIVIYCRATEVVKRYKGRNKLLLRITRTAKLLARDIERLAPAIDRENTPQNAEYPWLDNGKIISPCQYDFSSLWRLQTPEGVQFLRFIETAFSDFDEIRL